MNCVLVGWIVGAILYGHVLRHRRYPVQPTPRQIYGRALCWPYGLALDFLRPLIRNKW